MKLSLTKEYSGRRLTWTGRLLIATVSIALFITGVLNLYPFLAPNTPQTGGFLIIEGWIHDFALDEAITIYKKDHYSKIICTGVPIETGSYIQAFKSYPEMTTARLIKMGINPSNIITAISDETKKDRTYASAIAMRTYLTAYNLRDTRAHLITVGPHGRRSRLLFQRALGKRYEVGITSLDPSSYDSERWFTYSQGVRSVISELIAYTYAKFIFHP